jgi:3-dehydroquinate synthase
MIHRSIVVPLGDRTYPIFIGTGMTGSFAPTCDRHILPHRLFIITDTNVAKHYLKPLEKHLTHFKFQFSSHIIPAGERQKSLARANLIFTAMLREGLGRQSAVVALGGGVIGDLAGFVAAVYHRGVQLIQVPTTLLSQVDSSVGGKVAVNHPLGKNMIGAFYQPAFVWTDVDHLRTLPEREISCGLGEIIKYGVIWDPELLKYLERNLDRLLRLDRETVMHVLARCCEIKSEIVGKDEREGGLRTVLNFGHTVGHALEAAGHYRLLKHGEAVLFGMIAESMIARSMGMIDAATHQRLESLIRRVPLKQRLSSLNVAAIMRAMGRDKKSVNNMKRFVLPKKIGEVASVENVDQKLIESSLKGILR